MRQTSRSPRAFFSVAKMVLCAFVLIAGCTKDARSADSVTIRNRIGDDQRRETIEIRIDDGDPSRLEVRNAPLRKQRSVTVQLPDGIHSYALTGEMELLDGKKVPIRGSGAIVRYDWLAQRFLRDAKRVGVGKAWATIHQELAAHTSADLSGVALTDARRVTADDLTEAETRLGFSLPPVYRERALQFGSWTIGTGKELPASFAHPDDLVSLWDWIVRFHGTELKSSSAEWQKRFESTRGDLVAGTAGGAIVFHGQAYARCADGSPSFEIPAIEHDDFLYEDTDASEPYFSPQPANCADFGHWHAWHSLSAVLGTVAGPGVVIVGDETWIMRDTEASTDTGAVLFPESIRIFPWVEAGK
ncbi:MAG: SMI1/KNR4 family protein [Thermoanaerobaculia bacterium]|nr:SMI1/KNR4 family protein [Thermoanaerobaculia bacterium]